MYARKSSHDVHETIAPRARIDGFDADNSLSPTRKRRGNTSGLVRDEPCRELGGCRGRTLLLLLLPVIEFPIEVPWILYRRFKVRGNHFAFFLVRENNIQPRFL